MPKIPIPITKIFYDVNHNPIQIPNMKIDVDELLKNCRPNPTSTEQWPCFADWEKAISISEEE